jgi:probable HAF family extracellular repeat protein
MNRIAAGIGTATLALGLVAATATAAPAATATRPKAVALRDLGTLGGTSSWGTAVNDRGQVTGYSELADGSYQPFRWQDGVMTRIVTPGTTALGRLINNRGQVAGTWAPSPSQDSRGFLWDGGRFIDLSPIANVIDINDRGQAVGWAWSEETGQQAYLYDRGVVRPLAPPAPGGRATYVVGINERGQIAGGGTDASGRRVAVRWSPGGVPTDLGVGEAAGINADGVIVGTGPFRDEGHPPAYAWRGTTRISLGDLGGGGSRPYAVNDHGVVVGTSHAADLTDKAVLWRLGSGTSVAPVALPSSGFVSEATAINNRGWIVVQTGEDGWYVRIGNRSVPVPAAGAGSGGWPADINERGELAGTYVLDEAFTTRHAALWTIRC